MGGEKISIETFIELYQNCLIIDVRSEEEYSHAHIPGAYSIPLFNNVERKLVGTTYKQQSKQAAIKKGLEYFGPKMKGIIIQVEKLIKNFSQGDKPIIVNCWRGGMRSAGIGWLLDLYGFKIYTLIGGYQAYRNWVLHQFTKDWKFIILGGYTGSGKTIILEELQKKQEAVIDLEGIAGHKGSAFGKIGLPSQPSSEMFENILAAQLEEKERLYPNKKIWLEDESQRIGSVSIPHMLWKTIRSQNILFINIPFEERLAYLVETYGKLDKNELIEATIRIQKKLGGLETKNAVEYINNDDIRNSFRILLEYYDKLYKRSLEKREELEQKLKVIDSEKVDSSYNSELLMKENER
jgi:tRNA 2-selenouridine synthase